MSDPLGDAISSVQLLDCFGDDLTVVNGARVSFHKESEWSAEGGLSTKDTKLVKYLVKHGHWTPFAHPQLRFRIKMPIFTAREWYRHTVGFARNEVSRRYVTEEPQFYEPHMWRLKAESAKQGSGEAVDAPEVRKVMKWWNIATADYYKRLLADGWAPEMARMILPQSTYTEFIETGSLYAYARLVGLRTSPGAQFEINLYAKAIADLILPHFPVSWGALMERET